MVNVYIYINMHTIIYNICNISIYYVRYKRGSNIILIHYHHSTDRSTNLPSQQPKSRQIKMIGHNFLDVVFQGMMRLTNLTKYIWLDLSNHFFWYSIFNTPTTRPPEWIDQIEYLAPNGFRLVFHFRWNHENEPKKTCGWTMTWKTWGIMRTSSWQHGGATRIWATCYHGILLV